MEIRISRNQLQNPKESHHQALEDTLQRYLDWNFMVWLLIKNGKLSNCYQSYLSCYLLIFLIYQSCTRPKHKMDWIWEIRAFSSSLLHVIIACNHMPFFKLFSNFVHFCPNFQIFCLFLLFFNIFHPFLVLFLKIAGVPLLSRIGPRNVIIWH